MEQWQVGPVPEYIYGNSANHPNDMHAQHPYQQHIPGRRNEQMDFRSYPPQPPAPNQPHHAPAIQPPMNVAQQQHAQQQHAQQQHAQQQQQQQHAQQQHAQQHAAAAAAAAAQQHAQHPQTPHAAPQQPPSTAAAPPPAPAAVVQRGRKRPNPATATPATSASPVIPPPIPAGAAGPPGGPVVAPAPPATGAAVPTAITAPAPAAANTVKTAATDGAAGATPTPPPAKKSRTNTPWTPAEEHRLKQMRDAGSSWAEIAKTFPARTEGSVKKHWYKDMHYAEFAEDESVALLNAIKEYENQKWKVIGQKVGKPAKACEQYAKEHFAGTI